MGEHTEPTSYADYQSRLRATQAGQSTEPADGVVRMFGCCEAALAWSYQVLSSPGFVAHVKLGARKVARGVDDPTAEDIRDLAHTIAGTLRQAARPQAACVLGVLCGNDDGDRWQEALDVLVDGIVLERDVPPAKLKRIALVALQRLRNECLGWEAVPHSRYARALEIKRESITSAKASPKWKDAIEAIEERACFWHAQGARDVNMALRAKGIIR